MGLQIKNHLADAYRKKQEKKNVLIPNRRYEALEEENRKLNERLRYLSGYIAYSGADGKGLTRQDIDTFDGLVRLHGDIIFNLVNKLISERRANVLDRMIRTNFELLAANKKLKLLEEEERTVDVTPDST